jgi:hypothetical protein
MVAERCCGRLAAMSPDTAFMLARHFGVHNVEVAYQHFL